MEKYKREHGAIKTLICIFPFAFILAMLILFLILPAATFSISEKRYLAQLPSPRINEVINGSYMTRFEKYFSDQFPFRDFWISINECIS